MLRRDVSDGYVSPEQAEQVYGVKVDPDGTATPTAASNGPGQIRLTPPFTIHHSPFTTHHSPLTIHWVMMAVPPIGVGGVHVTEKPCI